MTYDLAGYSVALTQERNKSAFKAVFAPAFSRGMKSLTYSKDKTPLKARNECFASYFQIPQPLGKPTATRRLKAGSDLCDRVSTILVELKESFGKSFHRCSTMRADRIKSSLEKGAQIFPFFLT